MGEKKEKSLSFSMINDLLHVTSACDDDEQKKTLKVSKLFHLVAALENTSVPLELNCHLQGPKLGE